MTPKEILEHVRQLIREHAAGDPDKWWYANRYVFARLQLDERQTKTAIKRALFDEGAACHVCGEPFKSRRGVHLHRLDGHKGYSKDNCVLMHAECHRKHHAEGAKERPRVPCSAAERTKRSKRYEDMPYIYWWDISPKGAERLDQYESVAFEQKDTGLRCVLPTATLKVFLTPERQTTRGDGNWGIKVLRDHPDELAFEPGRDAKRWLALPVVWASERPQDR